MEPRNTTSSRLPRAHALVLAAAVLLGILACAVSRGDQAVDPQRWKRTRGPVVPHDTFPKDCSLCHAGSSWREIRDDFHFDHEKETGVALNGAHAGAECLRCHNDRGPVALFASKGCAGCHEDVHRGRLGTNCRDCHTETNWWPSEQVAMHNRTRFPLVGAHAAAACFRCHPGAQVGNFANTDTQCVTCHQDDLARATAPDHQAQGWVDRCDRCHIPTTWSGAGFNHSTFPLTGMHRTIACTACHANGVFAGTPNQCVDCHLNDYNATNDPNHVRAGFPTSCQQCHNALGWEPATFAHTRFPLTGAHTALACDACHAGGVYRGTPSNCFACHQDDYAATNDPNHARAGFPTSCQVCHNTSTWRGASFNHSFPITSGRHSGLDCSACHTSPGNFRAFSCIECHEHNASDTNNDHDRVNGYSYNSQACLSCHPNGQKD